MMFRSVTSLVFGIVFIVLAHSCIPTKAEPVPNTDHIIILAFDGWGASSFQTAKMPFLKSLIPQSAWTVHKRSVLPASSACNWATMFKGVGPEAHGYIDWDTRVPAFEITNADEKGNFPSFFSIYRKAFPNHEMGYFYQWEGMRFLFDMDDFNRIDSFPVSFEGCESMKDAAVSYIWEKKPAVAIFVWDYPDKTGHTEGWYTEAYMSELTHIDSIIEAVYNACVETGIEERTLFVITSDHGGHDLVHGQPLISDLETPFIMFGKGVSPGEIQSPLIQYDVAAILADFAHLEHPVGWRGQSPRCFDL